MFLCVHRTLSAGLIMICTKCGTVNSDGLKFCVHCGNPLAHSNAQDRQAPTTPDTLASPAPDEAKTPNDLPLLDDSSVMPVNAERVDEPRKALLSLADPTDPMPPKAMQITDGRNCPVCDAPLSDEFRFCVNCGARYSQYAMSPVRPVSAREPDKFPMKSSLQPRIPANRSSAEHSRLSAAELSGSRRAIERVSFVPQTSLPARAEEKAPFQLFHVNDDGSLGEQIPLSAGENFIGRTSSQLLATDRYVSPKHIKITCSPSKAHLEDCSSMNGSFIKISNETVPLQNGDIFRIGEELLCYFQGDSNQPLISNPSRENTTLLGGPESTGWGYLRVIMGAFSEGSVYRLAHSEVTLGRVNADIRFPRDGFVSGTHAALRFSDNDVTLTDLNSSNGTFVRMKAPKTVSQKTFILIGNQLLMLAPS